MLRLMVAVPLILGLSCGNDSTSPESGDRVIDAFPLELGNRWEYTLEQSIFIQEDTTQAPIIASSTGRQIVTVTRTENIGGTEAYGMTFDHLMGYLFSTGADTVFERRYMAPQSDGRVLLKAEENVYNPTGGFIPFGEEQGKPRYGTLLTIDGQQRFISLERLAYMLSDPRGAFWSGQPQVSSSASLASDGVQNNENAFLYEDDFTYVYAELYAGLRWVSLAAGGVGGIDISSRVTAILDELDGIEGPIAEVEQTNSFIGATASENYKLRYYFRSGIGLVRAEISDPEFIIILQIPEQDSTAFLGIGTWTFVKKLSGYTLN